MFKNPKPIILIFTGYYSPGYKAGGPIKSIANMIENLGNEFTFKIVTRDRDLGDCIPYPGLVVNKWQKIDNFFIYYLSPEKLTLYNLFSLLKNTSHSFLYLNSFFDINFTVKVLLASKFIRFYSSKIVLAPRGEFSSGALRLKSIEKNIYVKITKILGLYKNVIFQASSNYEKNDIQNNSPYIKSHIKIAIDLPSKIEILTPKECEKYINSNFSVVFLSRISPMKNLIFCLEILNKISRKINFDIYGPIEDFDYWSNCLEIINKLPDNIKVTYKGSIKAEDVRITLLSYDLLFLPSKGENYGHVIAESLSVGTPVLISDHTPWKNLEIDSLGWNLDLNEKEEFISVLENYLPNVGSWNRKNIQKNAIDRIINPLNIKDNFLLFKEI